MKKRIGNIHLEKRGNHKRNPREGDHLYKKRERERRG